MTHRSTRRAPGLALATLLGAALATPALAGQMFIFPNNNQTPEQQAQDDGACRGWARQQTGFDPMTASTQAPRNTEPNRGGLLRGGAIGAAGGAAVGAIAGDAGKGAAMGAVGGGLIGGMRRSEQRAEQKARKKNWEQQQDAARQDYIRAFSACMQGKGYTVN